MRHAFPYTNEHLASYLRHCYYIFEQGMYSNILDHRVVNQGAIFRIIFFVFRNYSVGALLESNTFCSIKAFIGDIYADSRIIYESRCAGVMEHGLM